MAAWNSVDEYVAAQPEPRRVVLEELRKTIRAAAPAATESIAYDMPAFRLDGQFLVSYAAYKNHYSLFPANAAVVEALGDQVAPYMAGKGTMRFPIDAAIPAALVTKVVKIRLAELGTRERR
jgi:uncharacterized protein YdhG (YjbR/CyaY superfamily)